VHVQQVCKAWRKHPSEGKLSALVSEATSTLPAVHTKGITAQDSKLYAKLMNGISQTPQRQYTINKVYHPPSSCAVA